MRQELVDSNIDINTDDCVDNIESELRCILPYTFHASQFCRDTDCTPKESPQTNSVLTPAS